MCVSLAAVSCVCSLVGARCRRGKLRRVGRCSVAIGFVRYIGCWFSALVMLGRVGLGALKIVVVLTVRLGLKWLLMDTSVSGRFLLLIRVTVLLLMTWLVKV